MHYPRKPGPESLRRSVAAPLKRVCPDQVSLRMSQSQNPNHHRPRARGSLCLTLPWRSGKSAIIRMGSATWA